MKKTRYDHFTDKNKTICKVCHNKGKSGSMLPAKRVAYSMYSYDQRAFSVGGGDSSEGIAGN